MAFVVEADAAGSLLRDARYLISRMRYAVNDVHSVLAVGSIGVEKLLKLSLGAARLRDGSPWPQLSELKKVGHGVEALDQTVRAELEAGIVDATRPHQIRDALNELDADSTWPRMVAAFDNYGRSGRFHFLNWLADGPDSASSPFGEWQDLETHVAHERPELALAWRSADASDRAEARSTTNEIALRSLATWQAALYAGWRNGAFGDLAQQSSSAIKPE
ncbi:hypothetical protein [Cnuibacter physcomitrellae]|uniref:hypothetical protein n=1 Tax=Cnuibacter physcomitrellae TaxID=1619308 RepID=UPI001C2C52DA|nr:hypothetical protein [Cnuibacter physcomitrellae]